MGGQNRVQEGLGRGSGLSLVDVRVSGPFPFLTPPFWSYLPFSVPLSVPLVVVMVVVACRPVVVVRALLVPLVVVLFALFGALVSRAVTGLVRPAAVMVVVVMVVVVPVGQWLVTLLLLGMPLPLILIVLLFLLETLSARLSTSRVLALSTFSALPALGGL